MPSESSDSCTFRGSLLSECIDAVILGSPARNEAIVSMVMIDSQTRRLYSACKGDIPFTFSGSR